MAFSGSLRYFVACLVALAFGIPLEFSTALASVRRPPSVILISVDTLRADRLSCYGYRPLRTPHIDAIAKGGTLFYQVSAQVPLTVPSHISLLTSTYPFSNGSEDNGQQLGPDALTLAEVLKSQGYRTAAFVGGFVLDRRFGLDQGFDVYDSPFSLHRFKGTDTGDIKRLGEDVVRAAKQWLNQISDQPFFVFLHLYDLHTPYNLPPRLRTRFHGSGYEAELGYVDEVLGDFWKFLAQRGLLERTLIAFTSDHGESLGDHGESTHGYFIYQSTLWVPLIIHWPAHTNPLPARVDEPANLLDLAPTILQFLGLPRPPEFQGRSLLELQKALTPPREVYSESLYARNHFACSALHSLRIGRYKYIEAPKPEFYDLGLDLGETKNLYTRRQSLAHTFREKLASLRVRFKPHHHALRRALNPETVALLGSLGYVAVSSAQAEPSESRSDPKDRIVDYERYGRAIVMASSGRWAEANSILERLLAKDPGLLDVRTSLGLNQQKLGRHAEAIQHFHEVLRRDPLNVLAHFNRAVSHFELGQLEEAVRECQAAIALAPYYTRAEELLATIWLKKKDYERARSHFNHILTIAPGDYAAHYNLGVLATMEGKWEEAERHLGAALKIDPRAAEVHNSLGSVYLHRGELARARDAFVEAIRLQPQFAWAHYNLGLVFRKQKKNDDAARCFRQALAADPRFHAAREALHHLERGQK